MVGEDTGPREEQVFDDGMYQRKQSVEELQKIIMEEKGKRQ